MKRPNKEQPASSSRPKRIRKSALDTSVYEVSKSIKKVRVVNDDVSSASPKSVRVNSRAVETKKASNLTKKLPHNESGEVSSKRCSRIRGKVTSHSENPKEQNVAGSSPLSQISSRRSGMIRRRSVCSPVKTPPTHSVPQKKAAIPEQTYASESLRGNLAMKKELRVCLQDVLLSSRYQSGKSGTKIISNIDEDQSASQIRCRTGKLEERCSENTSSATEKLTCMTRKAIVCECQQKKSELSTCTASIPITVESSDSHCNNIQSSDRTSLPEKSDVKCDDEIVTVQGSSSHKPKTKTKICGQISSKGRDIEESQKGTCGERPLTDAEIVISATEKHAENRIIEKSVVSEDGVVSLCDDSREKSRQTPEGELSSNNNDEITEGPESCAGENLGSLKKSEEVIHPVLNHSCPKMEEVDSICDTASVSESSPGNHDTLCNARNDSFSSQDESPSHIKNKRPDDVTALGQDCKHSVSHQEEPTEQEHSHLNSPANTHVQMLVAEAEQVSGKTFEPLSFKCDVCPESFVEADALKAHQLSQKHRQLFACPSCPGRFKDRHSLKRHRLIHEKKKLQHDCHVCGSLFLTMKQMKDHVPKMHPGQKAFKCTECESQFTELKALQLHKVIHTGERPYKCHLCDSAFSHPSTLKVHVHNHKNKKTYMCHVCQETFSMQRGLLEHMSEHEGAKAFKCDTCGSEFDRMGTFKDHLKIHSGEKAFQCTHCGKMFARKDYLGRHMRIHTGVKPYSCSLCGKRFTFWVHHQQHMWEHEDRRPYKCTMCDSGFRRSDHLRDHMRMHDPLAKRKVPQKKVPKPKKSNPTIRFVSSDGPVGEMSSPDDSFLGKIVIPAASATVKTEDDISQLEMIARQMIEGGHEFGDGDVQVLIMDGHGEYQQYLIKQELGDISPTVPEDADGGDAHSVYEITHVDTSLSSAVNTVICGDSVAEGNSVIEHIPFDTGEIVPLQSTSEMQPYVSEGILEDKVECVTSENGSIEQCDGTEKTQVFYAIDEENPQVVSEVGETVYLKMESSDGAVSIPNEEQCTSEEYVGIGSDEITEAVRGLAGEEVVLEQVPNEDKITTVYTYRDMAGKTHVIYVPEQEDEIIVTPEEVHDSDISSGLQPATVREEVIKMTESVHEVDMNASDGINTEIQSAVAPQESVAASDASMPIPESTQNTSIPVENIPDDSDTGAVTANGSHTTSVINVNNSDVSTVLDTKCESQTVHTEPCDKLSSLAIQKEGEPVSSCHTPLELPKKFEVVVDSEQVPSSMIVVESLEAGVVSNRNQNDLNDDKVVIADANPDGGCHGDLMQAMSTGEHTDGGQQEIFVSPETYASLLKIAANADCVPSENVIAMGDVLKECPTSGISEIVCGNAEVNDIASMETDNCAEVAEKDECAIGESVDRQSTLEDNPSNCIEKPVKIEMLGPQFRCLKCDKNFTCEEQLEQHMTEHVDVISYFCSICVKIFDSEENFKAHIPEHTLILTHTCAICDLPFSTLESLQSHIDDHTTENHCPVCCKKLKSGRLLRLHVSQHKRRKFVCSRCSRGYTTSATLSRHVRLFCKEFQCETCGRRCASADLLRRHHKLHRKAAKHACHICHQPFWKVIDLTRHMDKEHAGRKGFVCIDCGKEFSDQSSLLKHSTTHTGVKSWMCELCGKVFARSTTLKNHLRSHERRKYSCHVCNSTDRFPTYASLSKHMDVHPGRKPFKCDICSLEFTQFNSLKQHMESHSSSKHHQCQLCEKQFARKVYLSLHMKNVHTEAKRFSCPVCGRTFSKNQYMKQHMWTHTGERPFQCSQCSAGFTRSSHLNDHMSTHSNIKPYQCSFCNKLFGTRGNLQKHEKLHQNLVQ